MINLHNSGLSTSYAVGIDIGGTSLKCGLVNEEGKILLSFLVPLQNARTQEEIIQLIADAINQCTLQLKKPIAGVGIGFPGLVENGVIIGGADNLPGFEELPLSIILKELTGHTIVIDNDANLMGLGELTYGAAKDCTDAVFLTVGTGIGGAILIDKKLYGGFNNRGGELGHIIIQQNGLACTCGGRGCLEAYASVTALIDDYKSQNQFPSEEVDGKYIIEKYLNGEEYAVRAMERHFDSLAAGIASFINICSPQKVIIGGGISEAGTFYIDELRYRTKTLSIPAASIHTQIVAAKLGNQAAYWAALQMFFRNLKWSTMKRNNFLVVMILVIWFVISFVTNILGPLMPIIIQTYKLSLTMAAFLPFSFFLAYGIMSIPAGILIEKMGEKKQCCSLFL